MYTLIKRHLEKEKALVETIPGAAAIVNRFNTRMEKADNHWQRYHSASESVTLDKEQARKALVNKTMEMNAILMAFATAMEEDVLAKELSRIPVRLISKGAQELMEKAGRVHQLLCENLKGLSPWKITLGNVEAFGKEIEAFGEKKTQPRMNIEARSANRQKAEALMDEIQNDLGKLDKLIACAPPECREFALTYAAYRKTRKPYTTKMSFLGKVLLAGSLAPAVGAVAILSLDNRKYKVTPGGQLRIKNIREGVHTLTISHPGCEEYTVKINPQTGVTIRLEILLEAVADLQAA